jgi:hypothetical protein
VEAWEHGNIRYVVVGESMGIWGNEDIGYGIWNAGYGYGI